MKNDLTQDSVLKNVIRFSLPYLLSYFLQTLYGMADLFIIGQFEGVTFATGTPISNSMTELYTMMRYLQHDMLKRNSLTHFDCWASAFGETTTAIELAPEGYTLIGR